MIRSAATPIATFLILCVSLAPAAEGRGNFDGRPSTSPGAAASPAYCVTEHNVGRMALTITNHGTFGDGFSQAGNNDCLTGLQVQSCEYPKNSRTKYLFAAAIWIGAVLEGDTLVSVGADGWQFIREFSPDASPMGDFKYRSSIDPARSEYKGAVSEQDYIAVYYDTCHSCPGVTPDVISQRPHRPLNVEVTERSYAWSYSYAQDFVLFDYSIKNMGNARLRRIYMGIYVDADIYSLVEGNAGAQDDLCGFREKQPALYMKPPCPVDSDIVNIAWTVDNDGDFNRTGVLPVPAVTATRIIRTPADSLEVSFNWWVSNGQNPALDYGPQTRKHPRDMGTGGLGTPEGDRNKFYILSNGEFDYDQPYVASIGSLDSTWLAPPSIGADIWATGLDTRYVLSFGPFDVEPGQTLPISLAYVAGANFHANPENFNNLPDNPESWYAGVNFDSLGTNATWAEWVYDNPGVDTDSDGYSGEYTLCNLGGDSSFVCDTQWDTQANPDTMIVVCYWAYDKVDTVWRKGDGVPDFRGATPPPSPSTYSYDGVRGLRIEAATGRIKVRWNGVLSENTPDVFSREYDFEGYRVWLSRDDRASSYVLAASYDREDYNRMEWSEAEGYRLKESPFTLEQLRCLYGESCQDTVWHPLNYSRSHPLVIPTGPGEDPLVFYFEPQDHNQSILGNDPVNATTPIRKTFPGAPKPSVLNPDSIMINMPDSVELYLTEDGFIKYYEYEYTFESLLPTVSYWVNVTAFDYGSPRSGLEALETSTTLLPIAAYPLPTTGLVESDRLDAFVYPNPYRADEGYRDRGFEARGATNIDDARARRIHFANLPPKCSIRIYSLDGDLIREIIHDLPPGHPLANHDTWDLITRNSQQVVSGMYYWTVEDEDGRVQIGKLVVLL
jgi:hypothetical protein